MTKEELATTAGVSVDTISNIESGKIRPHVATIEKLAAALRVRPAALAEHRRRRRDDD